MRSWITTLLGPLTMMGCNAPQFVCERDDQCTLASQGVCEPNARCSYPDSDCPSGQRYSEHAGPSGGECVDAMGSATDPTPDPTTAPTGSTAASTTSDDPSSSEGPDPCLMVDCGPNGQCEPQGEQPTCVCEEGFVDQDLRCIEAGCPGTTCLWVDAEQGDDANPGTSKAQPIRTLARAAELAPSLEPGEALVLRRNQSWDEALQLTGLQGTEDAPIIVGAYDLEDNDGPGPLISQGLVLSDSVGVRIQDLQVTNPTGTALRLTGVEHATVLNCQAFEASTGCIQVRTGSTYTAVIGCEAWSCGIETYGISLLAQGAPLGDHHWFVDNRVDGGGTYNSLNITTGGADDVKVVGNYLRGSNDRGLHSRVNTHAWLVGNVVARAGDDNDAGLDHAGSGQVIARGNIVFDVDLPVWLDGRGEWAFNTVLQSHPYTAITVPNTSTGWSMHDNLVIAMNEPLLSVVNVMDVTADHNVYGRTMAGDCSFEAGAMVVDLAGWQATGQDGRSRCEVVPMPPLPAMPGSTRVWDDDNVLDLAIPEATWGGCADPVGAFDCDGQPLAAGLPPFEDIGHGWEGPPEVQARVELVP
ncbi:MAG: right-handed parallel beta-helix repeat-containing protein [Myxococcota bacterium]